MFRLLGIQERHSREPAFPLTKEANRASGTCQPNKWASLGTRKELHFEWHSAPGSNGNRVSYTLFSPFSSAAELPPPPGRLPCLSLANRYLRSRLAQVEELHLPESWYQEPPAGRSCPASRRVS